MSRGAFYYEPVGETEENLAIMRRIDELYVRYPFLGSRRLVEMLDREGIEVNRKRIQRLMRLMGLEAIYPKRSLSHAGAASHIYPYLLRGVDITRVNQVWASDITYIPMRRGFLYLVAILNWFSRYVLAWRLSNSLEVTFCLDALEEALQQGTPEIFNSDQGVQFTSETFTRRLTGEGIRISMDGRGRVFDNIFTERLWRSVKYEEVYLKAYEDGWVADGNLRGYFTFYNTRRPHQALDYQTPEEVYRMQAA